MRIILLLLFLGCLNTANGRDTLSIPRIGAYAGLGPGTLHAGVSFTGGKHEALAGIFFMRVLNDSSRYYPGVAAGYRFYPWGTRKRVRFFVSYDFDFFRKKLEQHLTGPSSAPDTWVMDQQYTGNYIGAGCRINIRPQLFFGINLGAGVCNVMQDFYYRYADGHELRSEIDDDFTDFAMTGRVALTYHFFALKRKAG